MLNALSMTKEEAQRQIDTMVADFHRRTDAQLRRMNEAQTRQSFINPLFEALGWDVRNPDEVSVEDNVARERADYIFRIGGVTQFIVEVKRPYRNLDDLEFKRQAITYAYNKGVNWAVLTNFRALRVFSAEEERLFISLDSQDYLENFEKLWLLSKSSWQSGHFEREARQYGALRPRVPVEKSLFDQLRQWRETLFNEIAKYHPGLSLPQIDELIQQLLNRLIFIRTAEDRGIEEHLLLAALHQRGSHGGYTGELLDDVRRIFHEFAQRYDSDLFPVLNPWDSVFVTSDILGDILKGLYERPRSLAGYDFAAIDADVLGAVYEQYLGHVAEVMKERARQEERQLRLLGKGEDLSYELAAKKQKRKAQGIYYTPRWVVDYIVRQTVGRFLAERTYDEVFNMKILDPACGSGSFLIRAYDELLAYHARVQGRTPSELGWAERISILTRNIFGVDLDDQAVQIARLNLLLRALAKQELLPSLADTIRRGNSLISGGEAELKPYFGDAWRDKHPFTWEEGFPDIMARSALSLSKGGGFDVVLGNPPYLGFQGFEEDKPYLRNNYYSAIGRFDLYLPFIERGLQLLKEEGYLGFICPTNFMKRQHGARLRELLKDRTAITAIVDFQHSQVFEGAINYTCLLIVQKRRPENHFFVYFAGGLEAESYSIKQSALSAGGWTFVSPSARSVIEAVKAGRVDRLGELVEGINEGVVTGANSVFVVPSQVAAQLGLEEALLRPAIQGRHVERWYLEELTHLMIYPYSLLNGKSVALEETDLSALYPKVYGYLQSKRDKLAGRHYFESSGKAWFELWNERSYDKQAVSKIVCQEIASESKFALATSEQFYLDTVCGIVLKNDTRANRLYLLALLNSKLLEYYYKRIAVPKMGGFFIYKTMFLRQLPIRCIDFDNPEEKAMHDRLVALVEGMLELHKRKGDKSLPQSEKEDIQREIARTDREMDALVYDLYGLTEEERRLVEGMAKG
ncbi:MAG: N-6 DNA methylase [Chloroflexi bacterium]|nr:N-6 DNA methylase [Chloroflexota bacterium]